jgi:hypothetical protein
VEKMKKRHAVFFAVITLFLFATLDGIQNANASGSVKLLPAAYDIVKLPPFDTSDLPVMPDLADYLWYTIPELCQKADHIIYAHVSGIGDTFFIKPAYGTLSGFVGSDPFTPVTLSTIRTIKGENGKKFVCIQKGGITPTHIQLPTGRELKVGIDVIVFTNEDGYVLGPQGVYTVIGNNVVAWWNSRNEQGLPDIHELATEDLSEEERQLYDLKDEYVNVYDVDDFISLLMQSS